MNNINYNINQRFYDFSLNKCDFDNVCFGTVFDEQYIYFVSKLDEKSKKFIKQFSKEQINSVIYTKRLNNLKAIQNNVIYCGGVKDGYIQLCDYIDYYHLIFKYDVSKLEQIKYVLSYKYNIQNVNLYRLNKNNLIYIFDNDSSFETKINSPLFSNLNNRIHNYNKDNLIFQKQYYQNDQAKFLFEKSLKYQSPYKFWHCNDSCESFQYLYKFNNIFDQNWYNRFCQNFKLFLDKQLYS